MSVLRSTALSVTITPVYQLRKKPENLHDGNSPAFIFYRIIIKLNITTGVEKGIDIL